MAAIVFLLGLLATWTGQQESACLGFIQDSFLPMNVYVAGTESEGALALAAQGQVVYLNGPGLGSLRPGGSYLVVRPEGKVKDPLNGRFVGIYYRELGTVKIETVGAKSQTASVTASCRTIMKGDLVVPRTQRLEVRPAAHSPGRLSDVPEGGLASNIILGLDDRREMGTGDFCFLGVGKDDGVQAGDRFIVWRPQPRFNPKDLEIGGQVGAGRSYEKPLDPIQKAEQVRTLSQRELPKQVVGDLVVIAPYGKTSVARITNSLLEIHLGDLVVRQ
jgi:hypothetical protein